MSLIKVNDQLELKKLINKIAYGENIYIAMGAGSISNWVRNL